MRTLESMNRLRAELRGLFRQRRRLRRLLLLGAIADAVLAVWVLAAGDYLRHLTG